MSRRFTESDLAEVRDRTDLRDLISPHVDLKRAGGGSYKGLCPFHDERTPSFVVTPSRGTYHCFGCGEHGDVIEFVMRVEHLPFPDAVRVLAEKAGVTLVEEGVSEQDIAKANVTRRSLDVIASVDEFYRQMLDTTEAAAAARELASRGFTREDAQAAGCGWAPPGTDLLGQWLTDHGFTSDEAMTAGVLVESSHGGPPYAFLRNRLTWPIHNATGAVVGWGARRLSDEQKGKYVNSASSAWFDKSSLLYGWVTARKAAARTGRVVVAEGYTDVMAFARSGVDEAVAACGTAFGSSHARLIERSLPETTRCVFCFDGDEAGVNALMKTWREARTLLHRAEGVVPAEGDPCDVWRQGGDTALPRLLDTARPLTELVLDRVITGSDLSTPDGRSRAVREVHALLGELPDEVMRGGYAQWAADRLDVPVSALSGHVSEAPSPGSVVAPVPASASPEGQQRARDADLQRRVATRLCLSPAGVATWVGDIDLAHFTDQVARSVVAVVVEAAQDCDPASLTGAQWVGRLLDIAPVDVGHRISAVVSYEESRPNPDLAPDHELLVVGLLHIKYARAVDRAEVRKEEARSASTEDDAAIALVEHQVAREDVEAIADQLRRVTEQ